MPQWARCGCGPSALTLHNVWWKTNRSVCCLSPVTQTSGECTVCSVPLGTLSSHPVPPNRALHCVDGSQLSDSVSGAVMLLGWALDGDSSVLCQPPQGRRPGASSPTRTTRGLCGALPRFASYPSRGLSSMPRLRNQISQSLPCPGGLEEQEDGVPSGVTHGLQTAQVPVSPVLRVPGPRVPTVRQRSSCCSVLFASSPAG